jgi:hypothetical protein
MKNNLIFGHLLKKSFVTKFQSHESQHDHGLLWDANAPIYGLDSNNAIENFVEKYISYDNNKLAPNFHEVQPYRHKKTCRKKNQPIYRFNFPWLLRMDKRQIFKPFPMEYLTPSKRVHLGEINKKNSMNVIKLIYKQHLYHLAHD